MHLKRLEDQGVEGSGGIGGGGDILMKMGGNREEAWDVQYSEDGPGREKNLVCKNK